MAQADQTEHTAALSRPAFRIDPTHPTLRNESRRRALAQLRQVPIFRDVAPQQLHEFAQLAYGETFATGETVVRAGEPGATMYVIDSGRVEVVREGRGATPVVLATLGPGDFFGELSIFDREVRSASVVAVEDTVTLTIDRYDIVRVINRSPELALALLKSLSARLRVANARLDGPSA